MFRKVSGLGSSSLHSDPEYRWIVRWHELYTKCLIRALWKSERPGSWKVLKSLPWKKVIRRNVTCAAGELEGGRSKEKGVAGGTCLTERKLETGLVSAEGWGTRIGFRRSCCAERSQCPLGKTREFQITFMTFELMFVFEGHVRKRKEAKPSG